MRHEAATPSGAPTSPRPTSGGFGSMASAASAAVGVAQRLPREIQCGQSSASVDRRGSDNGHRSAQYYHYNRYPEHSVKTRKLCQLGRHIHEKGGYRLPLPRPPGSRRPPDCCTNIRAVCNPLDSRKRPTVVANSSTPSIPPRLIVKEVLRC